MTEPIYDVALSFAGQDRAYVHRVATALRDRAVRLFYDEFSTCTLWGNDLYLYLHNVYSDECRYVLVFTSEGYARNMWTSHERRSIQARIMTESDSFLLLVRLDDTAVPGFLPTLGYVDGRLTEPDDLADMVVEKLGGTVPPRAPRPIEVPLSEEGLRQVLAERPDGWEHILFAGTVWREWERLTPKRLDHELGVVTTVAGYVSEADIRQFTRVGLDGLLAVLSNVERLIGGDRLAWAMGAPDVLGDANRIQHLGQRFGAACEAVLDWAVGVRAMTCAPKTGDALRQLASLADGPLAAIGEFVDSFVTAAGLIAEAIAAGESQPDPIKIDLDLRLSDTAVADLLTEVARAAA